jgi:hypothetical protein
MLAALTKYQKVNNLDKDKLIELVQAQILSQQQQQQNNNNNVNPLGNLSNSKNIQQPPAAFLLAQAMANQAMASQAQFVTSQLISNNNSNASVNTMTGNNNSGGKQTTGNAKISPKGSQTVSKKLNMKIMSSASSGGGEMSTAAGFMNGPPPGFNPGMFPLITPCTNLNAAAGPTTTGVMNMNNNTNLIDQKLVAAVANMNYGNKKILPNTPQHQQQMQLQMQLQQQQQQQQQQSCLISPLMLDENQMNLMKQFNSLANLSPENAMLTAAANISNNTSPTGLTKKQQQLLQQQPLQKQPFDSFPT